MERLEVLYMALQSVRFEDLATLPKDEASKLVLQVELLQEQLREIKGKTTK